MGAMPLVCAGGASITCGIASSMGCAAGGGAGTEGAGGCGAGATGVAANDGVNVDAAGLKEKVLALGLRPVLRGAGACPAGGMYSSFSSQLIVVIST